MILPAIASVSSIIYNMIAIFLFNFLMVEFPDFCQI